MARRAIRRLAATLLASSLLPGAALAWSAEPTPISAFRLDAPAPGPEPAPPVTPAGDEPQPSLALEAAANLEAAPPATIAGPEEPVPPAYGPPDPAAASLDPDRPDPAQFHGFGRQVGAIKWEMGAVLAYYTAINGPKLFEDAVAPHFHKEGWFGKSTRNLGMDKLAHTYSAYVIAELLYGRLKHKTGDAPGIALTAAALASATMLYTEFWDSIERSAGWSWEDVAFNTLGSGMSLLRNSVPGLDRKLDFRLMIEPNADIVTVEGKRHFEQQRYFFALKLAGFKAFERGPLRFLELHAGYYGKDFTNEDRAAGIEPKRRIFFGVGVNLRELFFRDSRTRAGRAAGEVLDYFQPPYTAIHAHVTN